MNEETVFDLGLVYTSVNAEELKVGSKVYVAYDMASLKMQVEDNDSKYLQTIEFIAPESYEQRIGIKTEKGHLYPLAYLVSEPEENKLKSPDLKIGDVVRHKTKGIEYMVTGLDKKYLTSHIYFNGRWFSDNELAEDWEKVEE